MLFKTLKILYRFELERILSESKSPTIKYVAIAYRRVLREMDHISDGEVASNKLIDSMHITNHMKEKLKDMLKLGIPKGMKSKIRETELRHDLSAILGLGPKKIDELLDAGLQTMAQLKQKKWFSMLNKDTQMVIEHAPLRKIPFEKIKEIEPMLTTTDGDSKAVIVGSYRRGRPFSKDIDVLLCSRDKEELNRYMQELYDRFKGRVYSYAQGPDKLSLIVQPRASGPKYKVDVFRSEPSEYYSNLLYSTGSKEHNIKMRAIAKRKGMLLNQRGLYRDGERVNDPKHTERDIFAMLDMEYVEPSMR